MNEYNEPEESVDLDLKAEDARLREAVGKPTAIRIGEVTVHILHIAEWDGDAMLAASQGDWDAWAESVIHDQNELDTFLDASLVNYQLEAIFDACAKAGNLTVGKSKHSGSSSRRTRRR